MELHENFKYLIVDTGFAYKLEGYIESIEEDIKDALDYLCDPGDKDCDHCKNRILFVNGFRDYHNTKKITPTLESWGNITGLSRAMSTIPDPLKAIICFKCESLSHAFTIVNILMKFKHCGSFNYESLISMTLVDDTLIMHFSCENG